MTDRPFIKPIIGQKAYVAKDNFIGKVVKYNESEDWIIVRHPTQPHTPDYRYRFDEVQLISIGS
jgi:hypothetical protein